MSKDLFGLMRDREIATSNFLPTKKELKSSSQEFANSLIESGNYNLEELFAQALRMKEALMTIESTIKSALPDEDFSSFGLTGKYRSGGKTINYKDDEIYCQLKQDLDNRVELLKLAQKQDVLDPYGNEVPKVTTTERKSSLAITF